ncbi:hypothetical protein CDL12_09065 [Handroanthus impetiginosus]|uniref:Myb/SANT-like domain-containing protein n=1 Tax=Handroanthus impetiginosus TaxID=429701 RepID=A0A2G9HL66_9LAMI|nr:hypothetical protein CDL12_09065 [Handroanthus impetiginosus]
MVRLEKIMAEKFPNCGIMSKHIKSKLQVWKKDYVLIQGIISSSGGAGAVIDPTTHVITADSETVWSEYVKVHPGASKLRGRPFPMYSSWVEIFGNDRAQGTGAIDVGDAVANVLYGTQSKITEKSGENLFSLPISTPIMSPEETSGDDISTTRCEYGVRGHVSTSSSKRQKKRATAEDIEDLVGKWMEETSSALGTLVQQMRPATPPAAPPVDNAESQSRKAIYDAVGQIPELTIEERVLATHRLVDNEKYMDAFWSMCGEGRATYVRLLLRDGTGH